MRDPGKVLLGQRSLLLADPQPRGLFDQRLLEGYPFHGPQPVGPAAHREARAQHQDRRQRNGGPGIKAPLAPADALQRPPDLADVREALLGREGRAAVDDMLQVRVGGNVPVLPVAARHQPAQQHAEGVDVRPAVRLAEAVLLRRRVALGAEENRVRAAFRLHGAGDVEIDQHDVAVGLHDDVLRLDVPVDHGRLMGVQHLQDVAEPPCHGRDILYGQLAVPGVGAQRLALDVFPHDAQHLFVPVLLVVMRQAGMVQVLQQLDVRAQRKVGAVIAASDGHLAV